MRHLLPAILAFSILLTLLCGCAKRKENLTPEDEKFVPAYADLLVLSESYKASASPPDSSTYRRQVDSILSNSGLTRETFLNQLTILAQSPPVYQKFTEKVRKDLEHRRPKQPS
jgi:hypothetical protein